jgi:hypothetical protein
MMNFHAPHTINLEKGKSVKATVGKTDHLTGAIVFFNGS